MDLRSLLGDALWDWVFRFIAVCSMIMAGIGFLDVRALASCQAEYNEINNQRSRILAEYSHEERNAERKADDAETALFTSPILDQPASRRTAEEQQIVRQLFEEYRMALDRQVKERAEADHARALHPVPPPPSALCGK